MSVKTKLAERMSQDLLQIGRLEKNLILADDPVKMREILDEIDRRKSDLTDRVKRLETLISEENRGLLTQFEEEAESYAKSIDAVGRFALVNSTVKARSLAAGEGENKFRRLVEQARAIGEANRSFINTTDDTREEKRAVSFANEFSEFNHWVNEVERAEKRLIVSKDQERVDEYVENAKMASDKAIAALAATKKIARAEQEGALGELEQSVRSYLETNAEVMEVGAGLGNVYAARISNTESKNIRTSLRDVLARIVTSSEADMTADAERSDALYASVRNTSIGTTVLALLAELIVAFLLIRDILG